jgi:hypothetical protein
LPTSSSINTRKRITDKRRSNIKRRNISFNLIFPLQCHENWDRLQNIGGHDKFGRMTRYNISFSRVLRKDKRRRLK